MKKISRTFFILLVIAILLSLTVFTIKNKENLFSDDNKVQSAVVLETNKEMDKKDEINAKDIRIKAIFSLKDSEIPLKDSDLEIQSKSIYINDNNLKVQISSQDKVKIKGFTGKAILKEIIELKGSFFEYSTEKIKIKQNLPIGLTVDYVKFSAENITIPKLEGEQKGIIELERAIIKLDHENISMGTFIGSLLIENGELILDGKVKNLLIKRKDYRLNIN
ncbi:hypothetical protein J4214_00470 [Candidatus Woesearchaeota archaeon]|nr:hypothetical protein [Candidatus Woesearchaeota archaeon]